MPRKSLRRRRRRSSKKSKKTFTKQLTKRSKSKKIRGGVTTRNGVRRENYRFLSTLKAQDLTRLNPDIIGEIREMHPLLRLHHHRQIPPGGLVRHRGNVG